MSKLTKTVTDNCSYHGASNFIQNGSCLRHSSNQFLSLKTKIVNLYVFCKTKDLFWLFWSVYFQNNTFQCCQITMWKCQMLFKFISSPFVHSNQWCLPSLKWKRYMNSYKSLKFVKKDYCLLTHQFLHHQLADLRCQFQLDQYVQLSSFQNEFDQRLHVFRPTFRITRSWLKKSVR